MNLLLSGPEQYSMQCYLNQWKKIVGCRSVLYSFHFISGTEMDWNRCCCSKNLLRKKLNFSYSGSSSLLVL